ncbi:hypothetical protein FM21_16265 [Streptomyces mutabilis]|uniref:Uncharacterized protein n=1 Tax=Streptomyces mutabilis TaxID=67332 RepID=A0A086MUA0_9ACTN|nr:hypothetical protein FM21_16265 [Streptomyces mutabilis]
MACTVPCAQTARDQAAKPSRAQLLGVADAREAYALLDGPDLRTEQAGACHGLADGAHAVPGERLCVLGVGLRRVGDDDVAHASPFAICGYGRMNAAAMVLWARPRSGPRCA